MDLKVKDEEGYRRGGRATAKGSETGLQLALCVCRVAYGSGHPSRRWAIVEIGCIVHWLALRGVSQWWQPTEEEVHLCRAVVLEHHRYCHGIVEDRQHGGRAFGAADCYCIEGGCGARTEGCDSLGARHSPFPLIVANRSQ